MSAVASRSQADPDDPKRLTLLAELGVLDTAPEPGFDALTQAAAMLTGCPIALVSLVDGERQWFKSRVGIDATQTPRQWSFCSHAIRNPGLMEVRDAKADARFAGNPLVTDTPGIRFYAGQPLTVDGIRIGTLCVIDTQPRELSGAEREALRGLGAAVEGMLAERRGRVSSLEQQRRLTEFAMVAGDWLWETDAEHRVVWMSCAYANEPAVREPWVLGQPIEDGAVLDPANATAARPLTLHRLFDERHAFARAVVHCEAPGGRRYLSHSAVCRRDASGRWNGYRGITRDISAHVAAEQAHRDAALVLAELSAQVPDLIFQLRMDGQGHIGFLYASDRVRDIFELSAAQVTADAQVALDRCHPDDADRLMASIRRSAADLGLWRETFRVRLPLRGERVLSGHARPRRLDDQSVLWHGVLTDVTEQSSEAAHVQALGQAQVAAEKAVQVRSEFMSRVSHELRTPLNAILGFAQLLRLGGPTQPGADMLKSAAQIETAGAHLLSLVNDMLDLSSLDAGRLNLQLGPVAVERLVQRCVALVEPHAQQHAISVQVQADPPPPTVHADARAVQQMLFNLLGNAIKFGRPHSVVSVVLRHEPLDGLVALEITDLGRGIAPDRLPTLFEPFSRINTGGSVPAGSGLGLSISQKLVCAMGGRIDVRSTVGVGTTFTVRLPADGRAEPPSANDSGFGDDDAVDTAGAVGSATVLYIEDEPVNALLMAGFFKAMPGQGLRLIVAPNGVDGLRDALVHQPDLLLLDMNLPDLDGSTVLRRLRADPRTAHIPVIAVSADALPQQIRSARQAGFDDYWTKPISYRKVHASMAQRFPSDLQPP